MINEIIGKIILKNKFFQNIKKSFNIIVDVSD